VKSGGEFLQVWFPGLSNKRLLKLHPYENFQEEVNFVTFVDVEY
jgi:hypothetical protein